MRVKKPLLEFGPMGRALLAIAGALALFYLFQDNPDLIALHYIGLVFGSDVESWTKTRLMSAHRLNAIALIGPSPMFGLWGLMAVLLALHIHPARIRWWWHAALIALAAGSPLLGLRGFPYWLHGGGFPIKVELDLAFLTSYSIAYVLLIAVVFGATRSKMVLVGIALICIASTVSVYTVVSRSPNLLYLGSASNGRLWFVIAAWAWNPLLLAVLLSWAIPARIRCRRKTWPCPECQYDMRNLETNTCPECGVVNERAPVNATATPASE